MKPERDTSGDTTDESRLLTGARSPAARSRPGRSTPPYNPGLQKLVEGKQAWFEPLDEDAKARGFRGWHQRGYLPHYDGPFTEHPAECGAVDRLMPLALVRDI
jgi:hypothetical protein